MCIVIDVVGIAVVALVYQLLRGVSLDPPRPNRPRSISGRRRIASPGISMLLRSSRLADPAPR